MGTRALHYMLLSSFFWAVLAQSDTKLPPDIVSLHSFYLVPENTVKTTVLFNFTVQYSTPHQPVDVETESDMYVKIQAVDRSKGIWNVTLNTDLDYEYKKRLSLVFIAKGDVDLSLHTEVYVTDVNDNKPKFENLPYNAEVYENTKVNTVVYTNINTTDPDNGAGGMVTYSMTPVDSASKGVFVINVTSGSIQLNGSLDFEKTNFYHYIVTATDGGGLSSTTDLFFTVLDVQDTPPFFTRLPYIAQVEENSPKDKIFINVTAQDGDRGPNVSNAVNYSISGDPCVGLFGINSQTGSLSVKTTSLDRDSPPLSDKGGVCNIIVKASEVETHRPQLGTTTATATVIVTVLDVNDNAPTFSSTNYLASIKENSPSGVPLTLKSGGQITLSDKDEGTNSSMTISLRNADGIFYLEQTNIQSEGSVFIRVHNSTLLDYETSPQLVLEIVATDSPARGAAKSATARVTVNIDHVNEFAPEFNKTNINTSVPEGSPEGHVVVNILAFDRDTGGTDGTITYSLQNDQGMFKINPTSGVVTVASNTTDRETRDSYVLLVQAKDGGGLLSTTSLIVNIADVNDERPIFRRSQYEAILSESKMQFARPLVLEATDYDIGENSTIKYSLLPSSIPPGYEDHFAIDPTNGNLTVVRKVDFEKIVKGNGQDGVITLTAMAQDQGQAPLNSTVNILVTVLDENDNDPIFKQLNYSTHISENSYEGFPVITVHAADLDGSSPNSLVSYFIESGGYDRFRIDESTGEIKVSGLLDRETMSVYRLKIEARDGAERPKSDVATVNVVIDDVNDEIPTFGERREVTIDRNETTMGPVYFMNATDPDIHSQLQYSILWTESYGLSGSFEALTGEFLKGFIGINESSGVVMALKPFNKTATRKLSLAIQVDDANAEKSSPQSARGSLTINVIDINDNSPHFSPPGPVHATVTENSGEGTALIFKTVVHVADLDEGRNSELDLKIEGEFADYFEVYPVMVQSSADVIIRVKNNSVLDYETRTYLELNVTAKEISTSERHSDTLMVHVDILDENDHSPIFTQNFYIVSFPENTTSGVSICTVNAIDEDAGSLFNTVTYSLPDFNDLFVIDSSSGVVSVATGNDLDLDYEKRKAYSLTVEATDGGGRRGTATLNVSLTDVNDNSPVFEKPEYSTFLSENETFFDIPVTVKATDKDEGINKEIEYFILSTSLLNQAFSVNAKTGELTVVTPRDYESLPDTSAGVLVLVIGARDHGAPSLTSTVNVTITVKDVNDNNPQFDNSTYHVSVAENVTTGYTLLQVHAHDADGSAPNNQVFYSIEEGDHDSFQVGHTSGQIKVVGKLDRETVATYKLHIMASDEGSPPSVTYCDVYIDLSDVNDELPQFKQKHVLIEQTNGAFGSILNMSAVDLDLDSQLIYAILWNQSYGLSSSLAVLPGDQLTNWLSIDTEYGEIYIKRPLDSSQVIRFVLTLLVQDLNAFNPKPQQDTALLTVSVGVTNKTRRSARSAELSDASDTLHISKQGKSIVSHSTVQMKTVEADLPNKETGRKEWNAEVTFSAGLTHNQQVTEVQQIVYDIVFINDGSGYSDRAGTFTCPQSGEYVIEVHTFAPGNSNVWLSLYHNVTIVGTLEVHAEEDFKEDSMTVVLQLTKGDVVYVMSTPGHSSQLFGAPDTIWNTFSGYLLSPDSE